MLTRPPPLDLNPDTVVGGRRRAGRVLVVATASALLLLALHGIAEAAPVGHGVVRVLAEDAGPDQAIRKEAALAGYLSYGVMAMTVVYGILLSTGWAKRIVRRSAVYGGHMSLAITAQAFGVLHALSYIFQTQEQFSLVKTFVPFVGGGEIEVALGIVGLELMIGASVAVALVHKLNYRRFRKAHIGGTYAGAALTWLHVLTTSPEARAPGLVGITVAAAALACILLGILRLLPAAREDRSRISLTAAA